MSMFSIITFIVGILNPVFSVGTDALFFNPANLGLPANQFFSLDIVDVNGVGANNSFNIAQYNRYNGKFIDETGKEILLNSIPRSGLVMDTKVQAAILRFNYGNLAFAVRTEGAGDLVVPKSLVDLLLNGNELDRTYSSNGAQFELVTLARSKIGLGKQWGNFVVGASLNYIRGLFYAQMLNYEARILTTRRGFSGEGCVGYLKAQGGNGWTVDVGAAYCQNRFYLGVAMFDLGPGIVWREGVEERYWTFRVDSANLYELLTESGKVYYREVRGAGNEVVSYLPVKFNVGIGYQINEVINAGVVLSPVFDLESVRLNRFSAELTSEVTIRNLVPVCLTAGFDNRFGLVAGIKTGLIWKRWNFRLGVKEVGGLFWSGKGVEVGFAIGYAGYPKSVTPKSFFKI